MIKKNLATFSIYWKSLDDVSYIIGLSIALNESTDMKSTIDYIRNLEKNSSRVPKNSGRIANSRK